MNDVPEMLYYFEFKMYLAFKRGICSGKILLQADTFHCP